MKKTMTPFDTPGCTEKGFVDEYGLSIQNEETGPRSQI